MDSTNGSRQPGGTKEIFALALFSSLISSPISASDARAQEAVFEILPAEEQSFILQNDARDNQTLILDWSRAFEASKLTEAYKALLDRLNADPQIVLDAKRMILSGDPP